MTVAEVPFFRPDICAAQINEVVEVLRSGSLHSGGRVQLLEEAFKSAVNARHAVAVTSSAAALHLAVEALECGPGDAVLVPTVAFAATAAAVRHRGAVPVFVDCDPATLAMDLNDAVMKVAQLNAGRLPGRLPPRLAVRGIIPVHIGGLMMDVEAVRQFAREFHLWTIDDAAHAFPSAWRQGPGHPWRQCGEGTAAISCFSLGGSHPIAGSDAGLIVTGDASLAERVRLMAFHGLPAGARAGAAETESLDDQIAAPGFKYNLGEIAAAIGLHEVGRAGELRRRREQIAQRYFELLADIEEIELPPRSDHRIHSWQLFPIRLRLEKLGVDRSDFFVHALRRLGVGARLHWRPLHLHQYYRQTFAWRAQDCPVAAAQWERLVSLPIFSAMEDWEVDQVAAAVRTLCGGRHRVSPARAAGAQNDTAASPGSIG